ncbi:GpE family phage tail protein [Escherichia coli]|uniref:GpE family phage tail protein n=1 Tax=Escherichia coli TaxID=562 RepID=UPI001F0CF2F0|nr:GpE family phage tail protein [Escherichia coli]
MRGISDLFFYGGIRQWQEDAAELTWFFHWSPREAWRLTMTEIIWWKAQSERISELMEGDNVREF